MVKQLSSGMSLTGNGLRDWLIQRFSAVILAIYFLVLIIFFYQHPALDYAAFHHFFKMTAVQVLTLLALICLFLHAWVGIWTVTTDYIDPGALQFTVQVLVLFALAIYLFWGISILWR